jgi:hypothetical protein
MSIIEGKHLGQLKMLPARPGTCEWCAVTHDPTYPHNAQSLHYQYRFYNEHGVWPTWLDAMSHCTDEVRNFWVNELTNLGVDVAAGKVYPKQKGGTNGHQATRELPGEEEQEKVAVESRGQPGGRQASESSIVARVEKKVQKKRTVGRGSKSGTSNVSRAGAKRKKTR